MNLLVVFWYCNGAPEVNEDISDQASRCSEGSYQHHLDSDDGVVADGIIMVGVCAEEKGKWEKLRSHSLSPGP